MSLPVTDTKLVQAVKPAAIVDNASYTVDEVDTQGFDYAELEISIGATDIALAACQVTSSDTSGSGHANLSGATFSTLPSATDDNTIWVIGIDLRSASVGRYLDATITAGDGTAGTYLAANWRLSRAGTGKITAAARGLADWVQV